MFKFRLPKTKLIFGDKSLRNIGKEASVLGNKVLLVTGKKNMEKLGFLDHIIQVLREEKLEVTHYGEVTPNPTVQTVADGTRLAVRNGCNLVVGLGGGSVIDVAKGIAITAGHADNEVLSIWDFVGWRPGAKEITGKTLPVIGVTSTSGTGSHVTNICVITNSRTKEKSGISSDYIFPRISVIDPEILIEMPPYLTAVTGFDVLAHSSEAFVSRNSTPISDLFSLEAMRLVFKYLPRAYSEPDDKLAREKMALADTYAGWAISTSRAGLPHAMAHPLSGYYPSIAHGIALAALTVEIVKYNIEKTDESTLEKYSLIGEIGGRSTGGSPKKKAEQSVGVVEELLKELNLDVRLREFDVAQHTFEDMARGAFRYMAKAIEANPRSATIGSVGELYRRCY